MDNANTKGNSSKKYRLYVFSVFLAVIMALSCVAIVAFDSDESSAEYTDVSTFEQLSAAVADPQGKEIRLTADISAEGPINVCVDVTLDLAGHVISPSTAFNHSGGADYIFGVKRAGSLTINDSSNPSTGKITTGTADSNFYVAVKMTVLGEAATGDVATLVVNNGTIEGNQYGISGNGNRNGTSVTINGGTVKALLTELAAGENSIGIYHPQEGTLTVTGGTISGWQSGIEIRSGNLVVSGGNISCVASPTEVAPNGNGGTVTGAAVAVAQHTTLHKIDVKISGGTFTGASAFYECNPQNNPDAADDITMEITGGTFTGTIYSQDETGFVKGGTYSDSSCMLYLTFTSAVTYTGSDAFDPATWKAMSKSGSMWFGSVYYPFKYFSGQTATIDVLKDCEDSSFQLFTGSNITLNLNGFDITTDGYDMFQIASDVTSASLIINATDSTIDASGHNVLFNAYAAPAKHGFDLTVNGGTYKGDTGFILYDADEVTISNATIITATGGVWCGNAGAADIMITGCNITSSSGPGAYFGSVAIADIIGSTIVTTADDESAVEIKSGAVNIDKNTVLKAKAFGATTGDINHNGTGSGNAVVFINNAYCADAGVSSAGVTIEKGATLQYTGGGETNLVYIVTDNAANPISVGWEDNTENVAFFVNKEVSVQVNGEDCKYSVVILDSQNGTVTSSAPAGVYQQEITLTITPDTGYEIDTLTVTDAASQAVQVENNKFKIPSSNVTVTATFKLVSYTITYTNDGNGTVSGAANAAYGDVVSLTVTPNEGFIKKSVTYLAEGSSTPVTIGGAGFEMPAANVTVTATFGEAVARIGENYYLSLADAVDAATAGDEIVILVNHNSDGATISKDLTIDFNGKTVTLNLNTRIVADAGTVVLKNGTLVGNRDDDKAALGIYDASTVTLDSDMVFNHTGLYAAVVWGDGTYGQAGVKTPTFNVKGTINAASGVAISTNGTDESKPVINILAGADISASDIGIYVPAGALTISGGSVTGATAVYFKAGSISITGGTITGNGAAAAYEYSGDGANATGDALVIDSCNYPAGIDTVSVTGGEFNSTNANPVGSYKYGEATLQTAFISGGDYNKAPAAEYIAEGKIVVLNTATNRYEIVDVYTVTIDIEIQNGTVTADKATAAEGETVTLTITPNEGYVLSSVSYTAQGSSEPVEITGTIFDMPAANVTVTATFEPITYTVTLSKDDGITKVQYKIDDAAEYTDYTTAFSINYGQKLIVNAVPADGYDFTQWAAGITANPYTIDSVTADVTLSAVSALGTVAVTFDANGGTGTMAVQNVPYNTATALNQNTFTKEHYTFAGWATSETGEVVYADKAEVTLTEATTLYAKWNPVTFKVTYVITNGPAIPDGTAVYGTQFNSAKISANEHYVLPANVDSVTVGGVATLQYSFENGVVVIPANSVTGDIVITAVCPGEVCYIDPHVASGQTGWGQVNIFGDRVVRYGDSITAGTGENANRLYIAGNDFGVVATPAAATSQYEYAFVGWSWTPEGATVTGNLDIVANFERNVNQFDVTLNKDTGITKVQYKIDDAAEYTDYTAAFTVNYGQKLIVNAVPADGYTFTQWAAGITANPYTIDSVTADVTLSAESEVIPVTQYTVTLNTSTGITGFKYQIGTAAEQDYSAAFQVDEGSALTIAAVLDTGYEFVQWAESDVANPKVIASVNADVTLSPTAALQKFTITLNLMGGYFVETPEGWAKNEDIYTKEFEYGATVDYGTADPVTNPSLVTYWTFDGWDPAIAEVTGAATYCALWEPLVRTFNVTFTDDVTVTQGSVVLSSPAVVNAETELTVIAVERAGYTATIIGVELVNDMFTVTSDVDISVEYTAAKYTVTITGEGVTVMAGTTVVKSGDKVDYGTELTATIAEKTGYIGTVDPAAVTVTSDVEIIGSYAPIKYTVAFDANGGTGTMDSMQMTYDDAKALTAVAFTRADYAFAGWATAADGKAVYGDGATVSNLTATDGATVTLYAAWLQVEKKDNTAEITVTTDTVSDQAAQAVVDAAKDMGAGSVAVINATETDDVSVKSDYIKQAADSNVGVTLGTKSGSMELSAEVLKNLNLGTDATLKTEIKSVETPSGYDLKKNAVVYSILLTSNGTPYTTQFGTGFTVKLAYTPASGEDTSKLKVYYLADDGKLEEMADCQYADGFVTFTTTHLSQYAVSLDVDAKDTTGTMEFLLIFFALIAVLIATPILASKAKKN